MFDPDVHDLVLTDHAMPGDNGLEVAKAVKSQAPEVPVVLLTGFGDIMNDSSQSADDVDLVVSKPVIPGELNRAIARVVRRGSE